MKKIIVGRPINGITLNGLEYLLDESNNERFFDSEQQAKEFLLAHGYEEDDMEFFVFQETEVKNKF